MPDQENYWIMVGSDGKFLGVKLASQNFFDFSSSILFQMRNRQGRLPA